jgi:hypothetical protein
MMGWRNGGGLRLLPLAALLLLLLVNVPYSEGKGSKGQLLSELKTLFGARAWLNSNGSRWAGALETRSNDDLEIVDMAPAPDGSSCMTGDNPVSKDEVTNLERLFKKFESETMQPMITKKLLKNRHWVSFLGFHQMLEVAMNTILKTQCSSRVCSLDAEKMVYVCGELKRSYADGKSCVDGSEPMTKKAGKELMEELATKKKIFESAEDHLKQGDINSPNVELEELLGSKSKLGGLLLELNKFEPYLKETPTGDAIEKLNKHSEAKYSKLYICIY